VLFPALLQGDKAVGSIRAQLKTIKRFVAYFDAVAIIRGGGDDIGLNCYDNFALAKEVALFPLPVITGIGHSTNDTVVEMIAHTNKITPTDVGYYLIQKFYDFESHVIHLQEVIIDFAINKVKSAKNELKEEINLFNSSSSHILIHLRQELDNVVHVLNRNTQNYLFTGIARISQVASAVRYGFLNLLSDLRHSINTYETTIRLLDPVTILKRGYSITFYKDLPLIDAGLVKKDDTIVTKLFSGTLFSKVESTDTSHGKEDNIH
jgi:exodeoxyribonuclease VII large subunit